MTHQEFKTYIMPYHGDMYRMAFAAVGREADAEDVVQETMLRLYRCRSDISSMSNIRAYCLRSVRNEALAFISRRRDTVPLDPEINGDTAPPPDTETDYNDSVSAIERFIGGLPENQATVFRLSALSGYDTSEIAEATGYTESNIRQILSRTRRRLRGIFETEKQ